MGQEEAEGNRSREISLSLALKKEDCVSPHPSYKGHQVRVKCATILLGKKSEEREKGVGGGGCVWTAILWWLQCQPLELSRRQEERHCQI